MAMEAHLEIVAAIDPARRTISATVTLQGVTEFYLHDQLAAELTSAGLMKNSEGTSPFVDSTRLYRVASDSRLAEVRWSGTLPASMAEGANVIRPDYLELCLYSAWFPVPAGLGQFAWRLELDLPAGWELVSNGVEATDGAIESRAGQAVGDILIVASPHLRRTRVTGTVEVIEFGARDRSDGPFQAAVARALQRLQTWFGVAELGDRVSVLRTPRAGFAYSRAPLVLLPADGTDDDAATFHLLHHELAHLWWNVAPAESTDDWLNEALAEYSAIRLTGELLGLDSAQAQIERHRTAARTSLHDPPIAETSSADEASFYANKYARGSLFFHALAEHLGEEALDHLLAAWRQPHRARGDGSTARLIDHIAEASPALAREAHEVLRCPSWSGTWPDRSAI